MTQKEKLIARHKEKIHHMEEELEGMVWLLDRGLDTENALYYPFRGAFFFGWRNPLTSEQAKTLSTQLEGFPFEYGIREEDKPKFVDVDNLPVGGSMGDIWHYYWDKEVKYGIYKGGWVITRLSDGRQRITKEKPETQGEFNKCVRQVSTLFNEGYEERT